MAIAPGTRLGHFEVVAAIGAGGMGEVYKARDTRLDRIVAIKVLPAHLADRSESRERFEREAKTIASLNHPHICALFDIGRQDGTDYLVMEYLEGETLAHRLQKGPLPLEQTLQFAIEMSDALDKAHRKGITHRDLKPGNIMLTKTGTKLLDFGLAKLKQEAAPVDAQMTDLPTMSEPLTAHGAIVGTLQYMAPEQLEGKEVDARTDIFAFGTVVYEMATGKKAFEGKSQASLIAKILETDPPPMSSLQPMMPVALDRVIRKCLAKDPEKRWQAASDVCDELKWIAEGGAVIAPGPANGAREGRTGGRRTLIFAAGGLFLVAAIAALVAWNLKPSSPLQPVTRAVIPLPPGQKLADLDRSLAVAISPDGTHLAYIARQGSSPQQLYLRDLDRLEAKPIPGTEGATDPFFSPDSQWIGFFAGAKLKKISVNGGAALTLGDAASPNGGSWDSHGIIAFVPGNVSVLQQMSDAGSAQTPLSHLDKGENSQRWPAFLPNGKAVLFTAASTAGNWINAQVAIITLGSGERRNLIKAATQPSYALSGHLVYAQGGSLMAVPFDSQRLAITGTPVPVVDGVLQSAGSGVAQYSLSSSGSLVYVPGELQSNQYKLVWVNRSGVEQTLPTPARAYVYPRLSPDGKHLAIAINDDRGAQIWLNDLGESLTRVTFGSDVNSVPVWTPDGKRIAFTSNREGQQNIFWQLADGSGGVDRLTRGDNIQAALSFTPDGQQMAFIESNPKTGYDVWTLQPSDHKAQPFLQNPSSETAPEFSPDGHWLAYVSNESGRYEIYVQSFPGPGGKWQISTDGGTEPVWNRNGRELFFRSGDKMMAANITTQPGFTAGEPQMLFEGPYEPTPLTFPDYDVSPDGQRFLMLKSNESAEAAPTQINIVLNWFEELKQKVPAGGK